LVRAEVDLKGRQVLFYTLRRRAPEQQAMVKKAA
jgi:hypothetical protein